MVSLSLLTWILASLSVTAVFLAVLHPAHLLLLRTPSALPTVGAGTLVKAAVFPTLLLNSKLPLPVTVVGLGTSLG